MYPGGTYGVVLGVRIGDELELEWDPAQEKSILLLPRLYPGQEMSMLLLPRVYRGFGYEVGVRGNLCMSSMSLSLAGGLLVLILALCTY